MYKLNKYKYLFTDTEKWNTSLLNNFRIDNFCITNYKDGQLLISGNLNLIKLKSIHIML